MTTEDALLAAVLANPDDDLPRLVYADWLEEHGEPERAEFIRVQVELARRSGEVCVACDDGAECECDIRQLRRRERELIDAHGFDWFQTTIPGIDLIPCLNPTMQPGGGMIPATIRRGFVDEIRCTLADWLSHGSAIVRKHPVSRVELSDCVPTPVLGNEDGVYWGEDVRSAFPDAVRNFIWPRGIQHWHTDRSAAVGWLSQALISWAKSQPV